MKPLKLTLIDWNLIFDSQFNWDHIWQRLLLAAMLLTYPMCGVDDAMLVYK